MRLLWLFLIFSIFASFICVEANARRFTKSQKKGGGRKMNDGKRFYFGGQRVKQGNGSVRE